MSTRWKNVALAVATAPLAAQIAKPESDRENTIIPPHMIVRKLPARVANGARKARYAARGDAPTTTHAVRATGVVSAVSQHRKVRTLAAKGW